MIKAKTLISLFAERKKRNKPSNRFFPEIDLKSINNFKSEKKNPAKFVFAEINVTSIELFSAFPINHLIS